VCALPLLLLGALLLALPARSAASDPARESLADSVHVLKNAVPEPSAEENEDMQVARELERVLKELQEATEQLESLKHRDQVHHHHSGAFDNGVQQFADFAPDEDGGFSAGDPGGSPLASSLAGGGSGLPGMAPATNGLNTPTNKGSKSSHAAFDKSWHHFRDWWREWHHHHHDYHHHQHPYHPGEAGRWTVTARKHHSDAKTTVNSKTTTTKASTSPNNGQKGLPTTGNASKTLVGNTKTATSTAKVDHAPHHDPAHAGKGSAEQKRLAFAKHLAAAHQVGNHVVSHPTVVHHPAAVHLPAAAHHLAMPKGRR
jgi:hypothetical protein